MLREDIRNSIRKYLTEQDDNITYYEDIDEDRVKIYAKLNNKNIGSISMEVLFDAYQYEFDDVFDEDSFYDIYPDDNIVKIEHIKVNDDYKNTGIGSELMRRGIGFMRKSGYNQFYLNASPMGFSGLNISDLVKFYKKFGFKVLLNQGHNVLMGLVFNE